MAMCWLRCIRYMGRRRRCSGAVGLGTVQSPKAKGECREGQRNREQGEGTVWACTLVRYIFNF